jgi:hypothetical protein
VEKFFHLLVFLLMLFFNSCVEAVNKPTQFQLQTTLHQFQIPKTFHNLTVTGHEHADVVAQFGQGARKRPGDICQAAGLGKGCDLGRNDKNV